MWDEIDDKRSQGWVKVYRSVLESDIFSHKHPDRFRLFMFLILTASRTPRTFTVNGDPVRFPPGSLSCGLRELVTRTGIEFGRLRRTIKYLEKRKTIRVISAHEGTIISFVNWEIYTSREGESESPPNQQRITDESPPDHNRISNGPLQELRIKKKEGRRKKKGVGDDTAAAPASSEPGGAGMEGVSDSATGTVSESATVPDWVTAPDEEFHLEPPAEDPPLPSPPPKPAKPKAPGRGPTDETLWALGLEQFGRGYGLERGLDERVIPKLDKVLMGRLKHHLKHQAGKEKNLREGAQRMIHALQVAALKWDLEKDHSDYWVPTWSSILMSDKMAKLLIGVSAPDLDDIEQSASDFYESSKDYCDERRKIASGEEIPEVAEA